MRDVKQISASLLQGTRVFSPSGPPFFHSMPGIAGLMSGEPSMQNCQPKSFDKMEIFAAMPFRPENYSSCHQFCGFAIWTDI
jgi:hypothetical protein